MSSGQNLYSREQLFGNADLPVVLFPTLCGSKRRHDPDISHASPYILGLTGTTLDVQASPMVAPVTVSFVSDDYTAAINAVNAAAPSDFLAQDDDGFLRLVSRHKGDVNWLKVVGGDAIPLLGFEVYPVPGSISFAGELGSSAPNRIQQNPQGTALIAHDEDITSRIINRAVAGALTEVYRKLYELDREVLSVVDKSVSVNAQGYFTINEPTWRVPLKVFGATTSAVSADVLDKMTALLEPVSSREQYNPQTEYGKARIDKIGYGGPPVDDGESFAAWLTPDGHSIFGDAAHWRKEKHAAITISEIRGNLVYCPGATFQTNLVQSGDTVRVAGATNTDPFTHNGEFLVDVVYGEDLLSVRPKSLKDDVVFADENKPKSLNINLPAGKTYGTLMVPVGFFLPMNGLTFHVTDFNTGVMNLRLTVGRRLSDMTPDEVVRQVGGDAEDVSAWLYHHYIGDRIQHYAEKILTELGPAWKDGTTNPGVDAQTQLDKIVTDLSADSGSTKIGVAGRTPWKDSTTNPTGASVQSAFDKIVTDLIADAGAARIGVAARTAWKDTTTNPTGVSILAALDKIVTDLIADAGAARIGVAARTNWKDGTTNPAGVSVLAAIDKIITDLNADSGAARMGVAARTAWKDSTTNPAASIYAAFEKIITDLIADAGAAKIGTAARTAWKDGTTNPTGSSVLSAIDKVITDLIADAGATRIGVAARSAWKDGTTNPAGVSILAALSKIIDDLVNNAGAARIGVAARSAWKDGTTNPTGVSVLAAISKIIDDLVADAGTNRIGCDARSNWRDTTTNPAGVSGLQAINKIITDLSADTGASKVGVPARISWKDGHSNPIGSVYQALDEIIVDLVADNGASRIGTAARSSWKDGTTNPASVTVQDAVNKIINDLIADAGAARIGVAGRSSWLDGTGNPTGVSVYAAIEKIITDLASNVAGSKKIGSPSAGALGEISAGAIWNQINFLSDNWMKKSRAETISGAKTFDSAMDAWSPRLRADGNGSTLTMISQHGLGTSNNVACRVYFQQTQYWGAMVFTVNARLNSADLLWYPDDSGIQSLRVTYAYGFVNYDWHASGSANWASWTTAAQITAYNQSVGATYMAPTGQPAGWTATNYTGQLHKRNVPKAWCTFRSYGIVNGGSYPHIQMYEAFNINSVAGVSDIFSIRVDFNGSCVNANDYAVVVTSSQDITGGDKEMRGFPCITYREVGLFDMCMSQKDINAWGWVPMNSGVHQWIWNVVILGD